MINGTLHRKSPTMQPMASYCGFRELRKRQAKRRLKLGNVGIPLHSKVKLSTFFCSSR